LHDPNRRPLSSSYRNIEARNYNRRSRKFGPNHLAAIDLGAPMLQSAEIILIIQIILIINAPLQLSPISGKHNFKGTTVEVN
jgi:hypothetical protein